MAEKKIDIVTIPVYFMQNNYSIVVVDGVIDNRSFYNATLSKNLKKIPVEVLKVFLQLRGLTLSPIIMTDDGNLYICLRMSTYVQYTNNVFSVICPEFSNDETMLIQAISSCNEQLKRLPENTYYVSLKSLKSFIARLGNH